MSKPPIPPNADSNQNQEIQETEKSLDKRFFWYRLILIPIISLAVTYLIYIFITIPDEKRWISLPTLQLISEEALREHLVVFLGLPSAFIASAFLVFLFKDQKEDAIELEALGLKIKGYTNPIVLWVICFLTIVLSINLLW